MSIKETEIYGNYFKDSRGEESQPEIGTPPVETKVKHADIIEDLDYYTSLDSIDDVDRFVEALRMLLEKAWGDSCPMIVDEYPTNTDGKDVQMPIIVYDSFDRVYAENTKKGPTLLGSVKSENDLYEIFSEWFETTLEFQILNTTTRGAKVLAKRFEVFMQRYIQYFKYIGISNMWFDKEPKSTPLTIGNQDYQRRVLRYKVKLERRYIRRHGETIGTLRIVFNIDGNSVQSPGIPGVYNDIGNRQEIQERQ